MSKLERSLSSHDDASEAATAVLDYQHQHADPFSAAETKRTVFVETDRQIDPGAIIKSIKSTHKKLPGNSGLRTIQTDSATP